MTTRTDGPTPRQLFATMMLSLATATRAEIDEPTTELYWRALRDVPLQLLREAAVELAATAKFMPKPSEWRETVDELLDRRDRLKAIDQGRTQLQLPGEVGVYECPDCRNTGFVNEDRPCTKEWRCRQFKEGETHTHTFAVRCSNRYCLEARAQKAAASKRYSRRD